MTRRKVNGYMWRQELARARQANKTARRALQKIIDERPSPALTAIYITEAALALGLNFEALQALEQIGESCQAAGGE